MADALQHPRRLGVLQAGAGGLEPAEEKEQLPSRLPHAGIEMGPGEMPADWHGARSIHGAVRFHAVPWSLFCADLHTEPQGCGRRSRSIGASLSGGDRAAQRSGERFCEVRVCATERCVETLSLGYREDSVCRGWAMDRARGWTLGSGSRAAACLAAAHVGHGLQQMLDSKTRLNCF